MGGDPSFCALPHLALIKTLDYSEAHSVYVWCVYMCGVCICVCVCVFSFDPLSAHTMALTFNLFC